MLRFFRSVRKLLVEQERTRKYLLYAIGEILLVVIGILLALQINTWNEQKKADHQEQSILMALSQETNSNLGIIEECIEDLNFRLRYGDKIRSFLSPRLPEIPIDSVNTWLGHTGSTNRCLVSTDILDELQSSGNLKNIRSVELRRQIGSWLSAKEDLNQEEDEWGSEFSSEYIPYTNKWISWDDVDYIFNQDNPAYFPSRFNIDPRKMLQEFEFSNIYAIHYWRMKRVIRKIRTLMHETTLLQEQIQVNMKSK